MTPTVSVVMAAKNYARFLPAAVESVFAQTHADWELVVIDDGSTDDTPAAVRPFLADPRVRYVRSDKLGQSRAKNLGIRLSRGDIVTFLDADDAWRPTKLEKQLALLRDDVGVVFCGRELIDEAGNKLAKQPVANTPTGRVLDRMFVQNFVCFSSAMVRRQVFDHVGNFDPQWDLAIDFDLWLRVARYYSFDYVPEPLVLYRTGHGNLSQKLSDRVATALSIMHRHRAGIAADAMAEGYASTARTMGWVLRSAEPTTAWGWYARALAWPHRRFDSLKGLVASIRNIFRRRESTAAENLTANI
jgi:glycosyltransferase involved in cell wall biosynthesis